MEVKIHRLTGLPDWQKMIGAVTLELALDGRSPPSEYPCLAFEIETIDSWADNLFYYVYKGDIVLLDAALMRPGWINALISTGFGPFTFEDQAFAKVAD